MDEKKIIFKGEYNSHEDTICSNNIESNGKIDIKRKQKKKEKKNIIFSSDNNITNKDKVNFDVIVEYKGSFIIKNVENVNSKDKNLYKKIIYKSHMFILDQNQTKDYPNRVNYRYSNYLKNLHLSKSFFCHTMVKE